VLALLIFLILAFAELLGSSYTEEAEFLMLNIVCW
jgi:hypothetical protein